MIVQPALDTRRTDSLPVVLFVEYRTVMHRSSEQIAVLEDPVHRLDGRIGVGQIPSGNELLERNRLETRRDRTIVVLRSSADDRIDLRRGHVPKGERRGEPVDPEPLPWWELAGEGRQGRVSPTQVHF